MDRPRKKKLLWEAEPERERVKNKAFYLAKLRNLPFTKMPLLNLSFILLSFQVEDKTTYSDRVC